MKTTLLLADDSATIQRVIELTFADEDMQVVAVGDGDSAIARIEHEPPDIVLADASMPGKNGYEVARYIKQSTRLAHVPVLLLTGAFEPVDERQASEAGCDGVLAKPFEPQIVISRVKELLLRSRDAATNAGTVASAVPPGEPAGAPPSSGPGNTGGDTPISAGARDDFLDRLDTAFATRSAARPDPPAPFAQREGSAELSPADRPAMRATTQDVAAPAPQAASQPMPALADAFAALLAAEQRGASPADAAAWAATTPAVTDDLVERVTHRVLERLTDQIVRQTVADLASVIAERLIREEIDRIKAAIK